MTGGVTLETLRGAALLARLDALAHLRGEVFRDWPYLYDANEADEAGYLRAYAEEPGAAVIVAWDGAAAVGASTCQPMAHSHAAVREAIAGAGHDPASFLYLGESVLRRAYRGQGIGVAFFERREAVAREAGLRFCAFCAVERAADDPRRPADYVPLDAFWRKRGYSHHPGIACQFTWREVGADAATPHRLSFWIKDLGP